MRRVFFVIGLIITALNATAQEKWTLQQCVDYALQNNVSVKLSDIQSRITKLTANQSRMNLYPVVQGSANSSYQHGLNENPTTGTLVSSSFLGGNLNLQASYDIFTWNSRKNTIIANNLYSKADQVGIDKAKNDVALVVANAFLQVMLRREQVRINGVQLEQSRTQLGITRKLVKAGSQPELNAIQIEAQMAKDSSNLLQGQALVQQSIINLMAAMNYNFSTPFDILSPNVESIAIENISELQPEALYNIALANQPLQKMYQLRVEAAQTEIKAARGSMYPFLTAFGSLNTRAINTKRPVFSFGVDSGSAFVPIGGTAYKVYAPSFNQTGEVGTPFFNQLNNNFGQSVGLSLNFSIFNASRLRSQWERSKINVVQLQAQSEQENLTLKTNIYNAYQDAFASLQKYNASRRTVDHSQRAFDMAKKRFDIGLLGTLDFIITQNNLYLAQIEEVSNHYDYVFKMKVLEFYKGQGIKL